MKQVTKKCVGLILTLAMLVGNVPHAMAAGNGIQGHWAQEALQSFISSGYLTGDGKGNYEPDGTMTRAQFAAILTRYAGLTKESIEIAKYTDVSTSDWYYSVLAKALEAGFMSGTSATTMSPNATVTRQEAFTMLARYLELDTTSTTALSSFRDGNEVAAYARGPVAAMISGGYVQGTAGNILPQKQLTRAEGVTVLYRLTEPTQSGDLIDGVYFGSGAGYGGTIQVQMTVSVGRITKIEVLSHHETNAYFNRAKTILDAVVNKQGTEGVDAVSGATRSSNGLLDAINACISQARGGADTSTSGSTGSGGGGAGNSKPTEGEDFSRLTDGVYDGSAAGYSGTTMVRVTVSGGKITAVEVLSHGDTTSYFEKATAVIDRVIDKQSTGVDAVSGATYSSYGILNAINNALADAGGDNAVTLEAFDWASLLQALAAAQEGDTIRLSRDITDAGQVDAISSATVTLNKAVTLDGNGKTISAYRDGKVTKYTTDKEGNITDTQLVDATFCFDVTTASGIQIENLTIDGASFNSKLGGAMYVETGAKVTLENVTFRNCNAGSTGAGNGGAAIYAEPHRGASPTVLAVNCIFENNAVNQGSTGRGGAVYGYNANLTLKNCIFRGNTAAYGGAVAAAGTSNLTVTGCTFAADNTAVYGGDDVYVFDGYTFYKKTMAADSAVNVVLDGNTHLGADGDHFREYRIVRGRVLGEVTDTTSSVGNAITKTCTGAGTAFLNGHDLTFTTADYNRQDVPVEDTSAYQAVLMNIPYAQFYAAELAGNTVPVDAVSSATKNKTRTGSLVSGSYHVAVDGTEITGVTYPVVMSKDDFARFIRDKTQITQDSVVSITVTNRGQTSTTTYTGKDALFESGSYAYYMLDTIPASFKLLTVDASGAWTIAKAQGNTTALDSSVISLQTESSYGDYQINLIDTDGAISSDTTVYAVILHTQEGVDYGLRHLENIWRGTELAFCTGFTSQVHGSATSSAHYQSMMGKTVTGITYLTENGRVTMDCNLYLPIKFACEFAVEDADILSGTAQVTYEGFPQEMNAVFTVENADGEDVTADFAVTEQAITWTKTPAFGSYTLMVHDGNGVYADVFATFTLTTSAMPAGYDEEKHCLIALGEQQAFADYLAAIRSVTVDGVSYAASGRGSVQVIGEDGVVNLDAQSGGKRVFADQTAGKTYTVSVMATGYCTVLTFTVTMPEA